MNVQCPNCKTLYRISGSKISDKGTKVICPKCQTSFYIAPVTQTIEDAPAEYDENHPNNRKVGLKKKDASNLPEASEPTRGVSESKAICGFWRRIFSFIIDVLFLLILFTIFRWFGGASVDEAVEKIWEAIESGIFILYFGLFNSRHGKGQTIGKRLTKIKVVSQHGKNISFSMSCLRAAILSIAFAAGSPALLENIHPFKLIELVGIGAAGAAIYLYIFNRGTRQSLHDIAVGTCVVSSQHSGKVDLPKIRKVHYAIAFTLAAVLIVMNQGVQIFQEAFLPKFESRLESLQPMREEIYKIDKVKEVAINEEMVGNKRYLQVIVVWEEQPKDLEKAGFKIAAIILKEAPDVVSLDTLSVVFSMISRVKIFSFQYETRKDYYEAKHSPEEWKKILESTILRSSLSFQRLVGLLGGVT
jgi:predicted Zn finger-like uncharacterized protein